MGSSGCTQPFLLHRPYMGSVSLHHDCYASLRAKCRVTIWGRVDAPSLSFFTDHIWGR